MATSTRRSSYLVLFFLPLLFVSTFAHNKQPPPPPRPTCDVKSLCTTAPFPELCSQSTSLLSPLVGNDLTMVVRAVLGVSLSSSKAATVHLKTTAVDAPAVGSCVKSMEGAGDMLKLAVKEMDNRLGHPGTSQYTQCVGTVQTLVKTAIADVNACLKVLGEVHNGVVVSDTVKLTVTHTMQLSSNALVFVNSLNRDTQATVTRPVP